LALVVDADDHALTATVVAVDDEQARVLGEKHFVRLRTGAWINGLINAIADRCVRHSRRDPRDSAPAEQALLEQLGEALEACRQERTAESAFRASQWFQNLLLRPEEIIASCARLVQQARDGVEALLDEVAFQAPRAVIASDTVSRLPGLVHALREFVADSVP